MKVTVLIVCLLFCLPLSAVEVQSWQTSNGVKVLFVEAASLPMVDINLSFVAGSAYHATALPAGTAFLTNRLLMSGAGQYNADDIAQALESVGAQMNTGSAKDRAFLSLRSLSDESKLATAVDVFKAVLLTPRFHANDLDREKQRLLAKIQLKKQSPEAMINDAYYQALYVNHAYAVPTSGTKSSVSQITQPHLQQFYQQFYVAANATLAIVGQLQRAEAEALANTIIGQLPVGKAASPLATVAPLTAASRKNISMPTQQVHIRLGQPGIMYGEPDYYALYVGNHILGGGGFLSRLMTEVRVKRGLAYGVYSYFSLMRQAGPFTLGMQTKADQAEQALQLLQAEVERFVSKGPTSEEVKLAKASIMNGFPLRVHTNRVLVSELAMMGFYGMPLTYIDDFVKHIDKVDAKDIKQAFQKHIHPQRLATVVVGPQP